MERVKEYIELPQEPPEFIEPRPPASWPTEGAIKCENLDIRYAVSVVDTASPWTMYPYFEFTLGQPTQRAP